MVAFCIYFKYVFTCYTTVWWQDSQNVSEEINHSNLPIQFVLECEGLNEISRILGGLGGKYCFQLCDWWSSYTFTEGRVILMTAKLTNHNHIFLLNGRLCYCYFMRSSARCALWMGLHRVGRICTPFYSYSIWKAKGISGFKSATRHLINSTRRHTCFKCMVAIRRVFNKHLVAY